MKAVRSVVIAVLAVSGVALGGVQMSSGNYSTSGAANGTGYIASSGAGGYMNTEAPPYGIDLIIWNPVTGEYLVRDGETMNPVSEIVAAGPSGDPPVYNVTYYDPYSGAQQGTGTWTAQKN